MSSKSVQLYTIGFTGKSAETFFYLLISNRVRKLIDTRVNNASQLSGFAKGKDLAYFSKAIGQIDYEHRLDMAPTRELLNDYRSNRLTWDEYSDTYLALLEERNLNGGLTAARLDRACLLCSEHLPKNCHRSLLAEYIRRAHPEVEVKHLV